MMSDITIYGKREDILDLTKRLQATIPGGRKLSQDEALSLAQLSVAHGLDPFNGEAWIIPGSGLMVGIKGLRKAAKRAAKEEDGVFWTDFILVDPSVYNAQEDAVVYECKLRDTITTQAWAKAVNIMTSADVPYKDAVQAAGPAPVVIGIGIATPDEKSKMPIHQRAKKRAEADAIKQRYDVALNAAKFSDEEPEYVDATFEVDRENGDKPRDENTILEELGYPKEETKDTPTGSQPELLPDTKGESWDEDFVKLLIGNGIAEHPKQAVNILNLIMPETVDDAIKKGKLYRGWRDLDKTPAQAGKLANEGKMPK